MSFGMMCQVGVILSDNGPGKLHKLHIILTLLHYYHLDRSLYTCLTQLYGGIDMYKFIT